MSLTYKLPMHKLCETKNYPGVTYVNYYKIIIRLFMMECPGTACLCAALIFLNVHSKRYIMLYIRVLLYTTLLYFMDFEPVIKYIY